MTLERWSQFSLMEQMANIGSEVGRTIKRKSENQIEYMQKALERALELFDLTLADKKNHGRLKEVARARECFLDFVVGSNQYHFSAESWDAYFLRFTLGARCQFLKRS